MFSPSTEKVKVESGSVLSVGRAAGGGMEMGDCLSRLGPVSAQLDRTTFVFPQEQLEMEENGPAAAECIHCAPPRINFQPHRITEILHLLPLQFSLL